MTPRMAAIEKLREHHEASRSVTLRELFALEPQRFDTFHARLGGLLIDYSKCRVTQDSMALLRELLDAANIGEAPETKCFAVTV